jgi:hypothetical protein
MAPDMAETPFACLFVISVRFLSPWRYVEEGYLQNRALASFSTRININNKGNVLSPAALYYYIVSQIACLGELALSCVLPLCS